MNNRFNFRKNRGFTIMEALIVVSIVIILPAIVISNFPQIKKQFALTRVAYKFSQDLREAQNLALSSVPYEYPAGILWTINGYGVYIGISALGNKNYIIYADDNNDTAYPNRYNISFDPIVKTFDLSLSEPEVVIKEINNVSGNEVSINFSPPNPDIVITSLNSGQNKVDIVFALESDLTKTKTVSINTSGLIKVEP